jgi:hypothetical protein
MDTCFFWPVCKETASQSKSEDVCMGEWRHISTFLDLGNGWRWMFSFTPLSLYPRRRSSQCRLKKRLSGPQRQFWCCREKKILPMPGIEPRPSSSYLVAIPSEVSRPLRSKAECQLLTAVDVWIKHSDSPLASNCWRWPKGLMPYSSMQLSPSWEAANCTATQELPNLWNSKAHYRVYKSHTLNHISPIHTTLSYLFQYSPTRVLIFLVVSFPPIVCIS